MPRRRYHSLTRKANFYVALHVKSRSAGLHAQPSLTLTTWDVERSDCWGTSLTEAKAAQSVSILLGLIFLDKPSTRGVVAMKKPAENMGVPNPGHRPWLSIESIKLKY